MAKGESLPVTAPKMEPQAHISWPGPEEERPKIKLSGDVKSLGLGKSVEIVLKGVVTGFSMQKYGCSLDLKTKVIRVESVSEGTEEDSEGMSMAEMVGKMGKRSPKKES